MKIFIAKIISCSLNYQPRYIAQKLMENYEITNKVEDADVIVFAGTCSCTKYNMINTLNYIVSVLNMKKPGAKTFMTGCLTREFTKPELFQVNDFFNKYIDYIIPQNQPNLLLKLISEEKFKSYDPDDFGLCVIDKETSFAQLFISSGCRNNCSFCKTCFQKLPLKSVALDELKYFIDGVDEENISKLMLYGTNLSQYGLDTDGKHMLPYVIEYIESKKNIQHIELIGFAFKDAIKNGFASVFRDSTKLKVLSGALESGSDRLLELIRKANY